MIIQIWSRKHGQVLLWPDVFFFPVWLPRFCLFYLAAVLMAVPWPKMILLFAFWVFGFYYRKNILHIIPLGHEIKRIIVNLLFFLQKLFDEWGDVTTLISETWTPRQFGDPFSLLSNILCFLFFLNAMERSMELTSFT